MRLSPTIATALFGAAVILSIGSDAAACVCAAPGGRPCQLERADAAFVGTVLSVTETRDGTRRFVFSVEEALIGVSGQQMQVESDTTSCGVDFQVGTSYLVASSVHEGIVRVSICSSYVATAGEASAEIAILRQVRNGTSAPTVYGTVHELREPGPDNRPADPELFPPLGGVRVTAAGEGGYRETMTDADGRFSLIDLPPGRYRVTARVNSPLRLLDYSPSFHMRLDDPDVVDVKTCSTRLAFEASRWGFMLRTLPPLAPATECSTEPALRSEGSETPVDMVFDNGRPEPLRLYWLDFQGARVAYATIAPGASVTQHTFRSHRWLLATEAGSCVGIYTATDPHSTVYAGP
jgi:hypothetical protein